MFCHLFIQQIRLADGQLFGGVELHPHNFEFDAFMFVYSITDFHSVHNVIEYYEEAAIYRSDECLLLLVGNKCDLEKDRLVESSQYARAISGIGDVIDHDGVFEISAKTGEGFDEPFKYLVKKLGTVKEEEEDIGGLYHGHGQLHFKVDDHVSVYDKYGVAHHGTVCWRGLKKRISRKEGEMCVEIQMV